MIDPITIRLDSRVRHIPTGQLGTITHINRTLSNERTPNIGVMLDGESDMRLFTPAGYDLIEPYVPNIKSAYVTVLQAIELRRQLEADILKLIGEFERATSAQIRCINLTHVDTNTIGKNGTRRFVGDVTIEVSI